ncbi:MAG: FxLYD domain-containing protein [Pseudomonadota bacterium]|nr:FxLYD domain-containing protein [Pseudomonadota bacterium]
MSLTSAMRPVRLLHVMRSALLALSLSPGAALWAQPSESSLPAVSASAATAASDAARAMAPGPQGKLAAIQASGVEYSYLPAPAERGNTGQLFVLGMLRNTGDEAFSSPVLQARFYDSQGQLVDVLTDSLYNWSLAPGLQGAVRLDGQARYPADRYARVELHLMSGDWEETFSPDGADSTDCAHSDADSGWDWREDLRPWWPFILILMLWGAYGLIWQRRSQRRVNGLLQQQLDLLTRQTEAQEKIARASAEKTSAHPVGKTE